MTAPALLVLNWRDPWHPEGGGSELYVQRVCAELVHDGVSVTMFTADYPHAAHAEVRDGIRYVRRGGHITVYLWAAGLLLLHRLGPFDEVLEVQNGMPFLATVLTRRPVVVLVHHVHREQWSILRPALARFGWFMESRAAVWANRRNRYLTVSEASRDELVGLGVAPESIRIAYNGAPETPTARPDRASAAPRLAVLSRLVPHKRIEDAISATAALSASFPELRLDVIGSGWWRDRLVRLAHELGVEDRVAFHGHVDEETKYRLLSRAWVHLLPSRKEGWGISVMEAAAVGVPTVAYRTAGGVNESVQDEVTGLLAHDYPDLLAQLDRLLRDEALRTSLGEKARIRAATFSWQATAASVRRTLGI